MGINWNKYNRWRIMVKNYNKTVWKDNVTPVNAANLNKIENAIGELFESTLGAANISAGDGIDVNVMDNNKGVEIKVNESVQRSSTIKRIESIIDSENNVYEDDTLYFVLDPDTNKLKKLILNGIIIYEVE